MTERRRGGGSSEFAPRALRSRASSGGVAMLKQYRAAATIPSILQPCRQCLASLLDSLRLRAQHLASRIEGCRVRDRCSWSPLVDVLWVLHSAGCLL